jgi:site-specific DNA-methyltransferase (adenine-specific)
MATKSATSVSSSTTPGRANSGHRDSHGGWGGLVTAPDGSDFVVGGTVEVQNKDCLDFLRSVEDASVSLVIADPPYFIGYDGGKGWDSQWASEAEYLDWCRSWTSECVRVLRPGGVLVVWGTLKTDTFLRYKLDVLNTFDELVAQNEIVWSYNWGGRTKKNFARKHEYMWCYSKGTDFLFNADDVRVERKVKKNIRTGLPYEQGTIPTCVWQINNHTTSLDNCSWHPTTKNLDVLERLVRAYSNAGDLVIDPFSGSGSTAIASLRSNRSFKGSELDEEYYELSLGRIRSCVEKATQ